MNINLIKFYKALKKSKVNNFAQGSSKKFIQPCVNKDKDGNITGVGTYERDRACYKGWTSVSNKTRSETCVPSDDRITPLEYPICEETNQVAERSDVIKSALKNKSLQGRQEYERVMDKVGASLLEAYNSSSNEDEKNLIKKKLDSLQSLQNDFISSMTNNQKESALAQAEKQLELFSKIKSPTKKHLEAKMYYDYVLYKFENAPDVDDFLPSGGYPKIKELNKDQAENIGSEYISWVMDRVDETYDKFRPETVDELITYYIEDDLKTRGKEAMKRKNASIEDTYTILDSSKFPTGLSQEEKARVDVLLKSVIPFFGGELPSGKKIRVMKDPDTNKRAYCNRKPNGTIFLNIGHDGQPDKTTIIHELGHAFEFQSKNIIKASGDFVLNKATGPETKLRDLTGIDAYHEDEKAYPGEFIHPYVGKLYRNTPEAVQRGEPEFAATEVLSKGVEMLIPEGNQGDMISKFRKDPTHLQYVLGVLLTAYNS